MELQSLSEIDIPLPLDELDTLGELHVALAQGKSRFAPGHDKITWQDLRNPATHGHEILLCIVNGSWETGQVHEQLKGVIIHPIPKPSKDAFWCYSCVTVAVNTITSACAPLIAGLFYLSFWT